MSQKLRVLTMPSRLECSLLKAYLNRCSKVRTLLRMKSNPMKRMLENLGLSKNLKNLEISREVLTGDYGLDWGTERLLVSRKERNHGH
jgi:hypothetical protein